MKNESDFIQFNSIWKVWLKYFQFWLKSESNGTDYKLIKNQRICFGMIIIRLFAHTEKEIFAALPTKYSFILW